MFETKVYIRRRAELIRKMQEAGQSGIFSQRKM